MIDGVLALGGAAKKGAEYRLQNVVGIDPAFQPAVNLHGSQVPKPLTVFLKKLCCRRLVTGLPPNQNVLDWHRA